VLCYVARCMSTASKYDPWARQAPQRTMVATMDQARRMRAKVARQDVNEFIEFVMRDEQTGAALRQAPVHEAFQELAGVYPRLLIWSHLEAGKTSQLSIGRTLWAIGRNPNVRVVIVSRTINQGRKILRAIKGYIERSEELRLVFPDLRPGPRWNDSEIIVQRTTTSKDPTVQVASAGVGSLQGARIDIAILDDVLTHENTRTPELRQAMFDWYLASIAGRVNPDGGQVIFVGNAFHPQDMMHLLAENPMWHSARFPVLTDDGYSTWPARWSNDRVSAKRIELGPHEFARQMLCKPLDEGATRFRREWIKGALDKGRGTQLAYALTTVPPGYQTYTGVDLGTRKSKKSDLTVLFTIIVHPNGTREVLEISSGRWNGPEIVDRLVDVHHRYASVLIVENVSAQQFIVDFTKQHSAIPVVGFTTGKNKWSAEFGLESLAIELANGKWLIPSTDQGVPATKDISAWIEEMIHYDPNAHTGDRLMAMWFAREGSRQSKPQARRFNTTLAVR